MLLQEKRMSKKKRERRPQEKERPLFSSKKNVLATRKERGTAVFPRGGVTRGGSVATNGKGDVSRRVCTGEKGGRRTTPSLIKCEGGERTSVTGSLSKTVGTVILKRKGEGKETFMPGKKRLFFLKSCDMGGKGRLLMWGGKTCGQVKEKGGEGLWGGRGGKVWLISLNRIPQTPRGEGSSKGETEISDQKENALQFIESHMRAWGVTCPTPRIKQVAKKGEHGAGEKKKISFLEMCKTKT